MQAFRTVDLQGSRLGRTLPEGDARLLPAALPLSASFNSWSKYASYGTGAASAGSLSEAAYRRTTSCSIHENTSQQKPILSPVRTAEAGEGLPPGIGTFRGKDAKATLLELLTISHCCSWRFSFSSRTTQQGKLTTLKTAYPFYAFH